MKLKDMIFLDFETEGFAGEITEISSIIQKDGKIESIGSAGWDEDQILNVIRKTIEISKEKRLPVLFWHSFMPKYLAKNYPDLLEELESKYLVFLDMIAYLDGFTKYRYSIIRTTDLLLEELDKHEGNAISDTIDLKDCFNRINEEDFNYKEAKDRYSRRMLGENN